MGPTLSLKGHRWYREIHNVFNRGSPLPPLIALSTRNFIANTMEKAAYNSLLAKGSRAQDSDLQSRKGLFLSASFPQASGTF